LIAGPNFIKQAMSIKGLLKGDESSGKSAVLAEKMKGDY
jgi:hypothetical protein